MPAVRRGDQVVRGVRTGGTDGTPGLEYRGTIFGGAEPLLADVCPSCGTVARLWIARLDRDWRVAKP